MQPQFGFASPIPLSPFLGFRFPMVDEFSDMISKGVVEFNQAEMCVQYFRARSDAFPFVIVPKEWSLYYLRSQRPLLLLSILCMATRSNKKIQHLVETELRESLSKKIIVGGEKSTDIVQSILVYLAW